MKDHWYIDLREFVKMLLPDQKLTRHQEKLLERMEKLNNARKGDRR